MAAWGDIAVACSYLMDCGSYISQPTSCDNFLAVLILMLPRPIYYIFNNLYVNNIYFLSQLARATELGNKLHVTTDREHITQFHVYIQELHCRYTLADTLVANKKNTFLSVYSCGQSLFTLADTVTFSNNIATY